MKEVIGEIVAEVIVETAKGLYNKCRNNKKVNDKSDDKENKQDKPKDNNELVERVANSVVNNIDIDTVKEMIYDVYDSGLNITCKVVNNVKKQKEEYDYNHKVVTKFARVYKKRIVDK